MMGPERCLEFCPGKPSTRREHGHMVIPPCACGTPELLSRKPCLVVVIVGVQSELGLVMKKRWLSAQKLLIYRDRWLGVMFRPRRSALLHDLTEECRLLVAPGKNGRNGLSQIRGVRWVCHSAFNHDWVSYIILIT